MSDPALPDQIGLVIVTHGNLGAELLKVLEHVEYIQPQTDGDVPPSTKKPSKKTSEEVLF